jgi:hypothetical protein
VEQRLRVYGNRMLKGYLDLRGQKWQENEEDYITRNFIICMLHQIW